MTANEWPGFFDTMSDAERTEWDEAKRVSGEIVERAFAEADAQSYVPTLDFLAWVVRQARIDGVLVTGKYEARDRQTWHRAILAMDGNWGDSLTMAGPPLPADRTEAAAMLAYFRAQSPEEQQSDYLLDLVVLLADDEIRRDRLALAASGLVVYRRAMEARDRREQEKRQRQASRHFGEVGRDYTVIATVAERHDRAGRLTIYRLVSDEGHVLTYFGTPNLLHSGWVYSLAVRVGRHDEYKGELRTKLRHCRIDRVIAEGSHAGPQAPHIARGA